MDIEEVQEFIEDSKELAYAIACVGFIAIGVVADLILDRQLDSNALRGVVTIVASLTGLFVILFALTHERAKEQQYNAYLVSADIEGAKEAKEAYSTLQSQVGELQAGYDQLAKECEHLRKSERSYIEKLQAQNDDIMTTEKEMILTAEKFATMKKELMTAKDELMTAKKELMTTKGERNKLKSSPLLELGSMCLEYRNLRSLGATNGINRDNEAKRVEYSQKAKELNVRINEHIESLV